MELLFTKSDKATKKLKLNLTKNLKKKHLDCTDVKKLEIMQKHQDYKKKLVMRREKKWFKFME